MISKLWLKLVGSFALLIIITGLIFYFIINIITKHFYQRMVSQTDQTRAEVIAENLSEYYKENNTWDNVEDHLTIIPTPRRIMGRRMRDIFNNPPYRAMAQKMEIFFPRVILASTDNRVVIDTENRLAKGTELKINNINGIPVKFQDKTVGILYIGSMINQSLHSIDEAFLRSVNLAVFILTISIVVVALLLGSLLFSYITSPLKELSLAARKIARGQFNMRVKTRQKDEIGDLGFNFNSMAASLQKAENWRRQIIQDAAHELRTPVSLIQTNLEMLIDGVYKLNQKNLISVYKETKRLSHLISKLEELYNAESGKLTIEKAQFNLKAIIEHTIRLFDAQMREKKIKFDFFFAKSIPTIELDRQKIQQVLVNILSNAFKQTPDKGRVSISVTRQTDHYIQICTQNSGSHIRKADIDHIFDRFYRVDKARNRDEGGSGLGLSICREIIKLHGGKIWAESKNNTVSIYFSLPF